MGDELQAPEQHLFILIFLLSRSFGSLYVETHRFSQPASNM